MSIDPVTGIVTYTPVASEIGLVMPTPVTAVFQATNSLGTACYDKLHLQRHRPANRGRDWWKLYVRRPLKGRC